MKLMCLLILASVLVSLVSYSPVYESASVLIMDAETGLVLYETEGFARRYPASITKVMTTLLVLEHVEDLDEYVLFSAHAINIPWYASRLDIAVGERLTVRYALYANMLRSCNITARALAEHVSGTVPAFVNLMNRRAEELGAYNTRFVNPCGLPGDGQFVTAYDVALIMSAAVMFPIFNEVIATPEFKIPPTELNPDGWELRNTNRMIRPDDPEFNEYVIGGKTGFTNAAGHTLVSYVRTGELYFIITVLNAPYRRYISSDTAALINLLHFMIESGEIGPALDEEPGHYPEIYPEPEIYKPYIYDYYPAEKNAGSPGSGEISDMEAAAVSAMVLGFVFLSLLFIRLFVRKKS